MEVLAAAVDRTEAGVVEQLYEVVPGAAEGVVGRAHMDRVSAGIAVEVVGCLVVAAMQQVVAAAAMDRVGAEPAVETVLAAVAVDFVAAGIAEELVAVGGAVDPDRDQL